jgi:hypothetical protein
MTDHPHITKQQAENIFLEIACHRAGKHSPAAIEAEFHDGPPDPPIDLSLAPGEMEDYLGCEILPTPAIAKYLAGVSPADPLTEDIVDRMVEAMETAYGIKPPLRCYVDYVVGRGAKFSLEEIEEG